MLPPPHPGGWATRIAATVAAAVLVAPFGGCAVPSPFKPALVDTSGPRIRHAAVEVRFHDYDVTHFWDASIVSSDIAAAFEAQAPRFSLKVSRVPEENLQPDELTHLVPGITHVIIVDAEATSQTKWVLVPGQRHEYCASRDKDGNCQWGWVRDYSKGKEELRTFHYVHVSLQVVDVGSGRTVYRSDSTKSPSLMGRVETGDAALDLLYLLPPHGTRVAIACLRALRSAKLF